MSKTNPHKIPKHHSFPVPSKTPKHEPPVEWRKTKPQWCFSAFDGAPFCAQFDHDSYFHIVAKKLRNYQSMTWGDISRDRHHNHAVKIDGLISEARGRLAQLRLDDVDELFRFRLEGETRIWGIKRGSTFQVLWWDPNHAVCPSHKKHT